MGLISGSSKKTLDCSGKSNGTTPINFLVMYNSRGYVLNLFKFVGSIKNNICRSNKLILNWFKVTLGYGNGYLA